ncbi:hypothetical protein JJD41_18370 [Oxynema sp. CENA135]|jgi:hypothetical protein|uniref:hypothetical protein n=1 Tax=Oxynema sp. CENA135 TaxID=984206 RepID=UPI00190B046D|nr:hypothetical protein [Oxynema sp. CENA135]MBK4731818.1 hypothetical protein [Oxynema sp. CENA135]
MRRWQSWWETLLESSQNNPPVFIELLMLSLAIALLGSWGMTEKWPYLVLSLSYAIGAALSSLVREAIAPSAQAKLTQATAVLLLLVSGLSFVELTRYF